MQICKKKKRWVIAQQQNKCEHFPTPDISVRSQCHTWVQPLRAEQDFAAIWCERRHHYIVDVSTLDVADVTAVLPGRRCAGVVVAAGSHLCDVAVAAAGAAPVHPQRVTVQPVEPDTWWTARTCKGETERLT